MLSHDSLEAPFAAALEVAELKDKLLTISTGSFRRSQQTELWNNTSLDVRDCYIKIVNLMFERGWPVRMSVIGSSGIGKSNMIPYLLWRRWQDDALCQFPVFVHQKSKIVKYQKGQLPCRVRHLNVEVADARSLYIVDSEVDFEIDTKCSTF